MAARKCRNSWWVDVHVGGKRHRKKSPDNSRSGAVAYQAVLIQELRDRSMRHGPKGLKREYKSLAEFVEPWMDGYATHNKPSEQRNKRVNLRCHILPAMGTRRLEDITTAMIDVFAAEKRRSGLSEKTVNNVLMTLSKLLRTAEDWGLISRAPKVRFLKPSRPKYRYLEPYQAKKLLDATRDRHERAMVLLGLRTGMRISELVALTWDNVDLVRRKVCVSQALVLGVLGTPKSNRERYIPLTADAARCLEQLGPATGFVFHQPNGEPTNDNIARRSLYKACIRAGMRPFGWHTLRHTFASQLAGLGAPLQHVQAMLGHESIETTMRYSHMSQHGLRAAVSMLEHVEERTPQIVPVTLGYEDWRPTNAPVDSLRQQNRQHSPSPDEIGGATPSRFR